MAPHDLWKVSGSRGLDPEPRPPRSHAHPWAFGGEGITLGSGWETGEVERKHKASGRYEDGCVRLSGTRKPPTTHPSAAWLKSELFTPR